ncbi:MAG: DUF2934 domain-containing protein, partial [Acidobacteria bacterium]|nr:DUF2934 domain-containing protein [Acidobacteriota bacterium]
SKPATATESLTKKAAPRRKPAATVKTTTTPRERKASAAAPASDAPNSKEIERLAYKLWEERGCPEGTSLEDWNRAQEMLLQSR